MWDKLFKISFLSVLTIGLFTKPLLAEDPYSNLGQSLMFYGGQMSADDFITTINPTKPSERLDIQFWGIALTQDFYNTSRFSIELETGIGNQYSDSMPGNDTKQIWVALNYRYKDFPWNDYIYTTFSWSIGKNYAFNAPKFEDDKDGDDGTRKLLHYLGPEFTFAHPDHRDWEAVFRLHHRSGIYGAMGCNKCGSNVVAVGIRKRF